MNNREIELLLLAMLASARSENEWPPRYPRVGTLLAPSPDPQISRDQWGVVEWRAYAEFLEEQGALIAQRLRHARSDLRVARNSLRRAKGAKITPTETLLTAKAKQKGKPGRPPSGKTESDANEVLALQAELQQTQGKTVSVRGAIKEHFIRNGRVYHPDHVRNLENVVSKVRVKFHKNRSR